MSDFLQSPVVRLASTGLLVLCTFVCAFSPETSPQYIVANVLRDLLTGKMLVSHGLEVAQNRAALKSSSSALTVDRSPAPSVVQATQYAPQVSQPGPTEDPSGGG